jgi:microcystin-dependent protein
MKSVLKKSTLSLALVAVIGGSWSNASYACPSEAYITSVCIMGMRNAFTFDGFMPAIGTQLPVNQYQAVMSLIGNTYGGDAVKTINLPDLRGRTVIGAGQGTYANAAYYNVGQTGGASISPLTLTAANLPPHVHTLSPSTATPPAAANGVTATTGSGTLAVSLNGLTFTVGTLAGTTTLAGAKINASAVASALTISASTNLNGGSGASTTPVNNLYLGSSPKIYNTASTPMVGLESGSITGISAASTIPLTLSAPAAVTITGAPAVTGTGILTGAPSVQIGGQTNAAGTGTPAAVPTMMPFLAMNYYFATLGVYPVNNN